MKFVRKLASRPGLVRVACVYSEARPNILLKLAEIMDSISNTNTIEILFKNITQMESLPI